MSDAMDKPVENTHRLYGFLCPWDEFRKWCLDQVEYQALPPMSSPTRWQRFRLWWCRNFHGEDCYRFKFWPFIPDRFCTRCNCEWNVTDLGSMGPKSDQDELTRNSLRP